MSAMVMGRTWKFSQRLFVLLLGLFFLAFGSILCYRSEMGLGPWDVLHQGLSFRTPVSFGLASIVVGLVILLVSLAFRIKPGLGTVINMLMVGVFADLLLKTGWFADLGTQHVVWRLAINALGVFIAGLGTALYISPKLGAGPRDSLMMVLHRVTKIRIAYVRASIECSALLIGILLGGTFGIGTFLFALGVGPAVEFWMWVIRLVAVRGNDVGKVKTA